MPVATVFVTVGIAVAGAVMALVLIPSQPPGTSAATAQFAAAADRAGQRAA